VISSFLPSLSEIIMNAHIIDLFVHQDQVGILAGGILEGVPVKGKGVVLPVFNRQMPLVRRLEILDLAGRKFLLDDRHGRRALQHADGVPAGVHLGRAGQGGFSPVLAGAARQHAKNQQGERHKQGGASRACLFILMDQSLGILSEGAFHTGGFPGSLPGLDDASKPARSSQL
jgi:hypothetical protein